MKKVMVVDDLAEIRSLIVILIRLESYIVIEACDGLQGLDLYRKEKPDLIITDINMPNMNGIEMVNKIHELDANAKVVVLSSEEEALRAAFNFSQKIKFVIKPFAAVDLIKAIKELH